MFYVNNLGDLELELERILLEKSDVQEILMKIEAMCSNHEQDKHRLQEELKKVMSNVIINKIRLILIIDLL